MQLLNALPRQPFLGLALAASAGILVADVAPNPFPGAAAALVLLAVVALIRAIRCRSTSLSPPAFSFCTAWARAIRLRCASRANLGTLRVPSAFWDAW